jgi:hypothetical protein
LSSSRQLNDERFYYIDAYPTYFQVSDYSVKSKIRLSSSGQLNDERFYDKAAYPVYFQSL